MTMLIEELQGLSSDWRSWVVVAIMAAVAVHSITMLWVCPLLHGKRAADRDLVAEARENVDRVDLRFGVMMFVGIVMAIVSLFMIAEGVHQFLALVALVTGIVIIQTEPLRSRIRENENRVIAYAHAEATVQAAAQARLRSEHISLAVTNVGLLVAVIVGLLAFR